MNVHGLSVIELRQYTLRSGTLGRFVHLFDEKLARPQAAAGAIVFGLYRDLDDPDRVVWLRGFENLSARVTALETFYGGEAWRESRDAANACIVDSDNALMLVPVRLEGGTESHPWCAGLVRIELIDVALVDADEFQRVFQTRIAARIENAGGLVSAAFVSSLVANGFPRLPLRADRCFVWVTAFPDPAAERRFDHDLRAQSGWRDDLPAGVLPAFQRKPEVLRLEPLVTYLGGRAEHGMPD